MADDVPARLWLGDASAAARVLRARPAHRRAWLRKRMLHEMERARAHVARTGRAPPRRGDGSLIAVALRRKPAGEPPLSDAVFCECLVDVLMCLAQMRGCTVAH
ncbi:hypothetical protein [Oceaniglobus trochenteri]|uniref:DUF7742 family protein n=1 Tax=Oceaniglobus trochenteri TaxID=2763260 RepID=UPI001D000747|nr:hypothetical protein [Oceaniglobus trochenteri]